MYLLKMVSLDLSSLTPLFIVKIESILILTLILILSIRFTRLDDMSHFYSQQVSVMKGTV
jgi:hypothetical protein